MPTTTTTTQDATTTEVVCSLNCANLHREPCLVTSTCGPCLPEYYSEGQDRGHDAGYGNTACRQWEGSATLSPAAALT